MFARGSKPPRSTVRRTALLSMLAALALPILLTARPALAAGATVTTATAAQKGEAGKSFKRGAVALEEGKLEDAVTEFRRSLDVVDSPNTRLMLARALTKLGRPAEAYRELEQTIAVAEQAAQTDKKYASAAEAARAESAEVRSQIGLVTVRVSGAENGDALSVGGEAVERAAWERPIAVAPGKVRVVLKSARGEVTREVDVAAGGSADVEIAPPAAPKASAPVEAQVETPPIAPSPPTTRTIGYIAGGVGIAGVVTFAVFGAMNNSKFRKLQDDCINNVCKSELESERDTGKTYQTIANVGLVAGVVGLGTSAVLLLISGSGESSPAKAASVRRSTASPARIGVGVGYVDISGSF